MLKQINNENMHKFVEMSQKYEDEFSPLTGAKKDAKGFYPVSTPIDETHLGYFYCTGANHQEIGFAIISVEKEPYEVCEFYIMQEYRKIGAGQDLACALFNMFPVNWCVKQLYEAKNANAFWISVISKYTGYDFTQRLYEDEKWGKVYIQEFSSRKLVSTNE